MDIFWCLSCEEINVLSCILSFLISCILCCCCFLFTTSFYCFFLFLCLDLCFLFFVSWVITVFIHFYFCTYPFLIYIWGLLFRLSAVSSFGIILQVKILLKTKTFRYIPAPYVCYYYFLDKFQFIGGNFDLAMYTVFRGFHSSLLTQFVWSRQGGQMVMIQHTGLRECRFESWFKH